MRRGALARTSGWALTLAILLLPMSLVPALPAHAPATPTLGGDPAATALAPGRAVSGAPASSSVLPASATIGNGWDGIDFRATRSCSSCALPNVAVASGNGYVVELTNSVVREWTVSGTLVLNESLNAFASVRGADHLVEPQVIYDAVAQRWLLSFLDVTSGNVYYGGSLSSDPSQTGATFWNVQEFGPPRGGVTFDQPRLAVNAAELVITVNLWSGPSTPAGFDVLAANETQLVGGTTPQNCATGAVGGASDASYVPASALSASNTADLVSDDAGGTSSLSVRTLTGGPTACTLSTATTVTTRTTAPPNASQAGTTDLLRTSGNITSATWRAGTLWVAATDGCTPVGDSVLRSCLHFWKILTSNDSLAQDFVWSRGPGFEEFYPSVVTDVGGDLAVTYGESSSVHGEDPSLYVALQASGDAPGTLEASELLATGGGPFVPSSGCSGSPAVCPFGLWSAAVADPLDSNAVWLAGEYTGADYGTNLWHTWISQASVAAGSTWIAGSVAPAGATLLLDGASVSVVAAQFNITVSAGTHSVFAALPGFVPFATNVTVTAGTGVRLEVVLRPLPSSAPAPGTGLFTPIPVWVALLVGALLLVVLIASWIGRRRDRSPRTWPKPKGGSGTAEIGSAIAAALDRRAASEREERERRRGGETP